MKHVKPDELAMFKTMLADSSHSIPDDALEVMLFPVLFWNNKGTDDGGPFVWAAMRFKDGWAVMEYIPHEDYWSCNTGSDSQQHALDFIRFWMTDYAPEWGKLYFRREMEND